MPQTRLMARRASEVSQETEKHPPPSPPLAPSQGQDSVGVSSATERLAPEALSQEPGQEPPAPAGESGSASWEALSPQRKRKRNVAPNLENALQEIESMAFLVPGTKRRCLVEFHPASRPRVVVMSNNTKWFTTLIFGGSTVHNRTAGVAVRVVLQKFLNAYRALVPECSAALVPCDTGGRAAAVEAGSASEGEAPAPQGRRRRAALPQAKRHRGRDFRYVTVSDVTLEMKPHYSCAIQAVWREEAVRGVCRLVRRAHESKETPGPSNDVTLGGTAFTVRVVFDTADTSRVALTCGEPRAYRIRFKDRAGIIRTTTLKIPEASMRRERWSTQEAWDKAVNDTLIGARRHWNEADKSDAPRYAADLVA